jgi:hypothetical protein
MEEIFSYGWQSIRKSIRKNLVAILYTVIFHLVVLIVLVFVKVQGLKQDAELGIQIEFEEKTVDDVMKEEEMKVPAEWLQEVLARREAASNRAVNVNAEQGFNKEISTDEYVNDLLDQIEKARNENDREKLEELQAILASADFVPPAEEAEEEKQGEYSGPTNITYEFLEEPKKRGSVDLTIPVYRCQGSGMVNVAVTVAPDGSVSSAEVMEPIEGSDRICFADAALEAARTSRFRIDLKAPPKQRAVITYLFVAQ